MKRRIAYAMGLILFFAGVLKVAQQLDFNIERTSLAQQVVIWELGECTNYGDRCQRCTPPNNCILAGGPSGLECHGGGGAVGCSTGPERAKGTCAFSILGWCQQRPDLCGTTEKPHCPVTYNQAGEVNGCGAPTCIGSPEAGPCGGC